MSILPLISTKRTIQVHPLLTQHNNDQDIWRWKSRFCPRKRQTHLAGLNRLMYSYLPLLINRYPTAVHIWPNDNNMHIIASIKCNQCLLPLMLWVRIPLIAKCNVLDITLCDTVCQRHIGGFLPLLRLPPPIKLTAPI